MERSFGGVIGATCFCQRGGKTNRWAVGLGGDSDAAEYAPSAADAAKIEAAIIGRPQMR